MRIHSSIISRRDITRALAMASQGGHGVVSLLEEPTRHGSRSHGTAWEVRLQGDGSVQRHRTQHDRDAYAASYDSWGWFLGHLFIIDPTMIAGPYKGEDSFHAQARGDYGIDVMLDLQRRDFEAEGGVTYAQAARAAVCA
jgi:hypothetical protein